MSTDALDLLAMPALLAIFAAHLPMVGYLYVGEARTLVYVGAQVEQLIGCARATLLAGELPLSNFWHPDDRERVELAINAALADRRDFCITYRMQHADGSWRWVEDRGSGVYDERGLAYLAGTLVDISERVAGEGRRREFDIQRDRDEKLESLRLLAGGIAHEFNNALLAVMGNLELAKLNLESAEPVEDLLDDALEATHHAAEKTRELLIYSGRGGSGRGDGEVGAHSSRKPSSGTFVARLSRAATVLVVDDEQRIRRMIRRVLEAFGCRVIEGADREQGQLLISAHADSIDLAILDVNLPQGKGTELFSQLRARRPRVPVLFSSGFEQPDVARGDDPTVLFLAKPYRSQTLVEHVTTLLDLGSD
jgi:PAS domain S-box-containing protein